MGFTVQPKDYQTAPVEAKALVEFLEMKSVAIIYDTSTFTKGIASDLRKELEDRNIDVPVYESVEEGQDDFEDVIAKASDADPDILYISTYHPEAAKILKEADEADALGECFVEGLAAQDPALVEQAGVEIASRCTYSGVPSPDQFGAADDYVSAYTEAYDRPPGTWGTFTYDSLNLLIDAVERAGEWDAEKVSEELSKTRDFEGITGSITIDRRPAIAWMPLWSSSRSTGTANTA